jgi:hypothetical protein
MKFMNNHPGKQLLKVDPIAKGGAAYLKDYVTKNNCVNNCIE